MIAIIFKWNTIWHHPFYIWQHHGGYRIEFITIAAAQSFFEQINGNKLGGQILANRVNWRPRGDSSMNDGGLSNPFEVDQDMYFPQSYIYERHSFIHSSMHSYIHTYIHSMNH